MGNVIEIRHYVSRAGKDIFDDWLTELADAHAQAKIATRKPARRRELWRLQVSTPGFVRVAD
jgi:putative component of toxin-antitoxin plasmid stabilization module